jgi:hypothetical protein
MKNQTTNKATYRRFGNVGVGGYHCPCCGPQKKDRQVFRRLVRRILKNKDRVEFKKAE